MIIFLSTLSIILICTGLHLAKSGNSDFSIPSTSTMGVLLVFIVGFLVRDEMEYLKSDKRIPPQIIIKTREIDGIRKADTTYVYKRNYIR